MKTLSHIMNLKTILFSLSLILSITMVAQDENSLVKMTQDPALEWGPCPDFMPEGCKVTVLHGDPAKKNADILIKFPANTEIPNHYHTSPERMILIAGELEVTYEGEGTKTLKEGSYAYGPALKHHTGRCGDAPCVLFIAFEEPMDAIEVKD